MRRRVYLLLALVLVAGCMEGQKLEPLKRKNSLYTSIGGEAKLAEIVDRFVAKAAATPDLPEPVRKQLQGNDLPAWKKTLTQRFAAVLGGPYRGGLEELAAAFKERVSLTPTEARTLLKVWEDAMKEGDLKQFPNTCDEVMVKLKELPELFATPAEVE